MIDFDMSVMCPSCGELAIPEHDGDVQFYACSCGMEFGYRIVKRDEPDCQLGIPEQTRLQFATGGVIPAEHAGSHDQPPVFLGSIGHRPEES